MQQPIGKATQEGIVENSGIDKNVVQHRTMKQFATKIAIVTISLIMLITTLVDSIMPDSTQLATGIKRAFAERETRLRFNGMISGNPRVNMEVSFTLQDKGNLADAYDEVVLAVGIMERANVRPELLSPYVTRMNDLKKRLAKATDKKVN